MKTTNRKYKLCIIGAFPPPLHGLSLINKAMKDLGAVTKEIVTEVGKKGDRTIRGKTYDDEVLTIDMEPTSPKSVNVEIRVGRIGSKDRAVEFHKAIQKYAKALTD